MEGTRKRRNLKFRLVVGCLVLALIASGAYFGLRWDSKEMARILEEHISVGTDEAGVTDQFGLPNSVQTNTMGDKVWIYRFAFDTVRVKFQHNLVAEVVAH